MGKAGRHNRCVGDSGKKTREDVESGGSKSYVENSREDKKM